ncbi:hypothetical protein F4553_000204 [Allocatelliglobosispora scoriae]|uniref:DUF1963 domain-containing protein n=1 Tax=Allocatelliglobosispora scoriae TaxID=643052 RepID=A0A841BGR3_9ACTN|nr:hypothetical protein [Allocatelliglobosispora scoriae]MBB5866825.1 hypothetical protein [Allocatelliglobosispora scoriae]
MTRTTPPRPLDIEGLFPELGEHSATATRLHPRPGAPTAADSSVGGPLLWPAGESWPVCTDGADHYISELRTPASVRRDREIFAAAAARAASGDRYDLTDAERAEVPDYDFSEPDDLVEQPIPLVAVAQLYRRDVPDFAGPDGTDLLQVLWCPLDHPEEGYNPRVRLYWRRSGDVVDPLERAPEPPVVNDAYLPTPCVVFPEQVREYRYAALLPAELETRIRAWEGGGLSYQSDLSLAPGWKVGGFAGWSLTDPLPMDCAECGAAMTLLFTAASGEWDGGNGSWRPVEEPETASCDPTGVTIGRGYSLHVFRCPASFEHPHSTAMQ